MQSSLTSTYFVLILCVVTSFSFASSRAPGDGDQACLEMTSRPQYDRHVHPLMDTRDYIQLFPSMSDGEGGVWKTLDRDGIENSGWYEIGRSCARVLKVCETDNYPQDNWVFTQHISWNKSTTLQTYTNILVMFDVTASSVCSQNTSCVEDLSLYIFETSSPNAVLAYDPGSYDFVANIRPGGAQEIVIPPSMEYSGLYLGIKDNGTCVHVNHVLVYYVICEATTVSLIQVNSTVFNGSASVQGECVTNSVPISSNAPLVECMETGEWRVVIECQCLPHYYMDNAGKECIQSPSAPLDVNVSDVTDTTVSLSWRPPENGSGIFYTVSHSALPHHDPENKTGLTTTSIQLTGLIPFLPYTFSVTSENEVSYQNSDVSSRTVTVSATTLEGVAAKVTDVQVHEGEDILVSWREPYPPHGHILYYNIKITESTKITTQLNYSNTYITLDTWKNDWKISSDNVKIQIQAETSVGHGDFSEPIDISTTATTTSTSTTESMADTSNMSTEIIIGIIVAVIVVLLVLIIVVLIIIWCTSWKKKVSHRTRHHIEEYASIKLSPTDTNFCISPPPLPRSPRPPNLESCSGRRCDDLTDSTPYAVLEGPTQTAEGNQYSLDPSEAGARAMFGVPSIDHQDYAVPRDCKKENGATFAKASPVYFELENPLQSSLIKHRVNRNAHPLSQSTIATGVHWNEGDPDQQPPATREQTQQANMSAAVTPAVVAPEPTYSEISTPSTAK